MTPTTLAALTASLAHLDRKRRSTRSAAVADPDQPRGNPHGLPTGEPIRRLMARTFRGMAEETLAGLQSGRIPREAPDLSHWIPATAEALAPLTLAYRREAGRAMNRALGLGPPGPPFPRANDDRATWAARSVVETTRDELQAALDAFRAEMDAREGKGLGELAGRLWERFKAVFRRGEAERAPVIAEAEASNAAHAGAIEAVAVATLDMPARPGKAWVCDGNPCPRCISNRSVGVIPLGSMFPTGHGWAPVHPRCMCSCLCKDLPSDYAPRSYPFALPPKASPASDPSGPGPAYSAPDRARRDKERMVWVDVAKLDAAWKADESFYVGPGGVGPSAIRGRYAGARRFIGAAVEAGSAVDMAQVYVGEDGSVSFVDGRHRFAALRDMGVKRLPVAVDPSAADRMAELYGARPPRARR